MSPSVLLVSQLELDSSSHVSIPVAIDEGKGPFWGC